MDHPIECMRIYQIPSLQVRPINKDKSKDQKHNTRYRYLLTPINVKWLFLS